MARLVVDPEVARLVEGLRQRLDPLAGQIADRIRREIELYRSEAVVPADELRRSVLDNISYVIDQLATAGPSDLSAPRLTGRLRAEQDVPLPEVLRAYRLGFASLWEQLLRAARASGQLSLDALLDTAIQIWSLADEYSQAMTDAYREAMAERMVAAERHRSALVHALVTGEQSHHGTAWEVAKQLDFPYQGSFLVVVGETAELGVDPLPGVASRLSARDVASAWQLQPDVEVGVLSLGRRPSPDAALATLRGLATTRVGVSPVFGALDQAGWACRFARIAMESLPAGAADVRQLAADPLDELVTASLDTTRRVVHRVLGSVLALPEEERATLLGTAQAWLAAGGSVAETGRALYCHPNTVRYRLRKITDHTGLSLDDPQSVARLVAALHALHVFPSLAATLPAAPAG